MKFAIKNYEILNQEIRDQFLIKSKPGIAKGIAELNEDSIPFINDLIRALKNLFNKKE